MFWSDTLRAPLLYEFRTFEVVYILWELSSVTCCKHFVCVHIIFWHRHKGFSVVFVYSLTKPQIITNSCPQTRFNRQSPLLVDWFPIRGSTLRSLPLNQYRTGPVASGVEGFADVTISVNSIKSGGQKEEARAGTNRGRSTPGYPIVSQWGYYEGWWPAGGCDPRDFESRDRARFFIPKSVYHPTTTSTRARR